MSNPHFSDLPIAGTPRRQEPIEAAPVQVWGDPPFLGSVSFHREGGGYRVRFCGIADFLIGKDGRLDAVFPDMDAEIPWQGSYLRQVRPLLWSLQGQAVFHGGAVSRDGRAIAFLGPSGRGKSTLTAACAARGLAFLTDDCLVLQGAGPRRVLPDVSWIRLREDSFEVLRTAMPAGNATMAPWWDKPRLAADAQALPHAREPAILAHVVLLGEDEGNDIRLEPMGTIDSTIAWCAHAFVVDQKAPEVMRGMMHRAAALAAELPMHRLSYPRDYARLDEVVAVVSGLLHAGGSAARDVEPAGSMAVVNARGKQ